MVSLAVAVKKWSEWFDGVLFWGLVCGLACLPLWPGRHALLATAVDALWFCGLAVAYEIGLLVTGRGHAVGLRHVVIPAALFIATVFWITVQNATWMPSSWHLEFYQTQIFF